MTTTDKTKGCIHVWAEPTGAYIPVHQGRVERVCVNCGEGEPVKYDADKTKQFIKDLPETEAICTAATLGPWEQDGNRVDAPRTQIHPVFGMLEPVEGGPESYEPKDVDIEFTAHARTKLPEACAAFREVCDRMLLFRKQLDAASGEVNTGKEGTGFFDGLSAALEIFDEALLDLGIEPGDDDGK